VQQQIIDKKLKFYVIDAYKVAEATGMGARINTIMQTCFFAISGILPREEAIAQIKKAIKKTYGKRGEKIVEQNWKAVDDTLAHMFEVKVGEKATSTIAMPPAGQREGPGLRARGHRPHGRRPGRQPARLQVPGGRHLPAVHRARW
jgi:pyruvate-ferredoxin/flavodoxin oxidoreductase